MLPVTVRRAPDSGDFASSGAGTGPVGSSLPEQQSTSSASSAATHTEGTADIQADPGLSSNPEAKPHKLGYVMDRLTSIIAFAWATGSQTVSAVRHPSEFFDKSTRNKFLVYAASLGTAAALVVSYFGFRSGKSHEESEAGNTAATAGFVENAQKSKAGKTAQKAQAQAQATEVAEPVHPAPLVLPPVEKIGAPSPEEIPLDPAQPGVGILASESALPALPMENTDSSPDASLVEAPRFDPLEMAILQRLANEEASELLGQGLSNTEISVPSIYESPVQGREIDEGLRLHLGGGEETASARIDAPETAETTTASVQGVDEQSQQVEQSQGAHSQVEHSKEGQGTETATVPPEAPSSTPEATKLSSEEIRKQLDRKLTEYINAELMESANASSIKEFLDRPDKEQRQVSAWWQTSKDYHVEVVDKNGERTIVKIRDVNAFVKLRKDVRAGNITDVKFLEEKEASQVAASEETKPVTQQSQEASNQKEAPAKPQATLTYDSLDSVQKEIGTALIDARAKLGLAHIAFENLSAEQKKEIWKEANRALAQQGKPSLDKLCKLREELKRSERQVANASQKMTGEGEKVSSAQKKAGASTAHSTRSERSSDAKNPLKKYDLKSKQQPLEQRYTMVVKDRFLGLGKTFELYDGQGACVASTAQKKLLGIIPFGPKVKADAYSREIFGLCRAEYEKLGEQVRGKHTKFDAFVRNSK